MTTLDLRKQANAKEKLLKKLNDGNTGRYTFNPGQTRIQEMKTKYENLDAEIAAELREIRNSKCPTCD